ncbi:MULTISPECIES: GNAT family N-acetyltransferase [Yersinia]|uniref:GNAT family N-acetyltransferase n=1 Tax=Yersinia TaxID=629 RepID=UPI000EAB554E|nr:GNAT family N-acetyltransferase [Yersinia sp. IP36721]
MLTSRRITHTDAPYFVEVDKLYESAFPRHEKRTPKAKTSALNNDNYSLLAWFDGELFVGMIGSWAFNGYTYIEHLAVSSQQRSQGYGKRILEQFIRQHPVIILEVDPLTTEIARKRLRFYQGLGFVENSFEHRHPRYHPDLDDHELVVLSYPEPISQALYNQFNNELINIVMGNVSSLRF